MPSEETEVTVAVNTVFVGQRTKVTRETIEELRRLYAAATIGGIKGNWLSREDELMAMHLDDKCEDECSVIADFMSEFGTDQEDHACAQLTAAMHNALPELLDLAERLLSEESS